MKSVTDDQNSSLYYAVHHLVTRVYVRLGFFADRQIVCSMLVGMCSRLVHCISLI